MTRHTIAPLSRTARGLTAAFVVSGVAHLVRPQTFEGLMPGWVPAHEAVIKGSGVAELVCAAGLLAPRTRRAAGTASAVLLVAVLPGNVEMARRALRSERASTAYKAGTLARLPLQWPLIRAARRAGRV